MRDVMRSTSVVLALGVVLSLCGSMCRAQGIRLIDECPHDLEPVERASAALPERHVALAWDYIVVATFVVDLDGSVVAPRIKQSRFSVSSTGPAPTPAGFDAAVIAAI